MKQRYSAQPGDTKRGAVPKLTTLILAGLFALPSLAAIPRFGPQELVQSGGVNIDVGYYGSPQMFDWNGDGKKDLVLGQYGSGKIRLYENVGEDSAPVFNGYYFMAAGGAEITLPAD